MKTIPFQMRLQAGCGVLNHLVHGHGACDLCEPEVRVGYGEGERVMSTRSRKPPWPGRTAAATLDVGGDGECGRVPQRHRGMKRGG
jgi:hypothetical protein